MRTRVLEEGQDPVFLQLVRQRSYDRVIALVVNPLEVICTSRVINWTANHLVSKASDCPTRDKGRGMNDPWCESSNARNPFLRLGVAVEDSLGGGLDTNRGSSGNLKYREEHSETYASAQRLSKM